MTAQTNTQHIGFPEVRVAAAGRWEGIHRALGVNLATTSHQRHVSCPGCGGKDRFRVAPDYQQTGRFFCSGGGDLQSGDGFALIVHVNNWTLAESLRAVADFLGLTKATDFERQQIKRKAAEQAAKLEALAKAKEEQARTDSNLLTTLENLIDEIRFRQHLQREAMKLNKAFIAEPTIDEVTTAQELNAAILEAYAHQKGADYV